MIDQTDHKRPFTPKDDQFHEVGEDIWHTETVWFTFLVPERNLAGWLYGFVRPNLGVCTSSVFAYDDFGAGIYDVPFHIHQQAQPIPGQLDLHDFTFPEGYRVKTLEPMMKYAMAYKKEGLFEADLIFDAVMQAEPYQKGAFADAAHYDQLGHVTGNIVLYGEEIPVDCYTMRDRSWGPRSDTPPASWNRFSYDYGCTPDANGFLVITSQSEMGEGGTSEIVFGWWLKKGRAVMLTGGTRTVERDPVNKWVTRIVIDALDDEGESHRVEGKSLSRQLWTPSRWISLMSLLEWEMDGSTCWGEDIDLWQYHQMSSARRAVRKR